MLENSGHKVRFNDLVVKDLNNGEILRVDHLFEKKGKGELFSKEKDKIEATFKILEELYPKRFPSFSKPFELGLMYKTNGSLDESSSSNSSGNYYFLRPETAQGSYLAFKKVLAYNQNKLPLCVAQFGKAFRNESSASSSNLKRLKEFNLAELQVFYDSDASFEDDFLLQENQNDDQKFLIWTTQAQQSGQTATAQKITKDITKNPITYHYLKKIVTFAQSIGLDETKFRLRQHNEDELAHYSSECWDLEVLIENDNQANGWLECVGLADRGCYDLKSHGIFVNQFEKDVTNYIPSVVEPSFGIDRLVTSVLDHNFKTRLANKNRHFFTFKNKISPYKVGITMAHNDEKYRFLVKNLHKNFLSNCVDSKIINNNSQIGSQYVKLDELGIPYILTFDSKSLVEKTVTIRDRDSLDQKRVGIEGVVGLIRNLVDGVITFDEID